MKKAVIMAGGFGTRLRPLTMSIPKPMVPIMNAPMMEHIVYLLKHHNIVDVTSLLYFQPDTIISHFGKGVEHGIDMKYVIAEEDYGTAGAVRNAADGLKERFIVISGDVLTDFDIEKALAFHIEKGAMATILLTRVETPLQYGIVMTESDGKISRFLEKPSWGQVFSDTINTGIYIFEPEIMDLIPYQKEYDFSQDLFPDMLRKGLPLYGYIADGYWRDIGNLNEYQQSQLDALDGKCTLHHPDCSETSLPGASSEIASSAVFNENNHIGKNTKIGEGAVITNCIIGDKVIIGNGVKLNRTTIWDNVQIDDFAELNSDVICSNCIIGAEVFIADNVFIAENCKIGKNAVINSNIKLWPNKRIEDGSTLSTSLVQEDKWQRELFSGARITGISNIEINPEFAAKLGSALGLTFGKNTTICASRASDLVSRIIKRAITCGLASVGVNVSDIQEIPIPQTRQELRSGKFEGGIHVRPSLRFPNCTDIIIFSKDGRDIPISTTKKIERYFFGEDIKRVNYNEIGNLVYSDRSIKIYNNKYLVALDIEAIRKKNFKLLIDYSYGMASTIFPSVLGHLNVNALSLNNYIDPTRIHPDPADNLMDDDPSGKIMTSLGYELGFSILQGAEKISVIDERGKWYSQNRMLSIITKLFLETNRHREPYKIAVSVAAPSTIDLLVKDYNVEVTRVKNNHSAMMDITLDDDYLFVGGIYGGYVFKDFLFASDAMFSIGKILEMLAISGLTISQIDESLPETYNKLIFVSVPWYKKGAVMRKAMDYSNDMKRELIDGIKILENESENALILPDQEKGIFSIFAESYSAESVEALTKKYAELIHKWKLEN